MAATLVEPLPARSQLALASTATTHCSLPAAVQAGVCQGAWPSPLAATGRPVASIPARPARKRGYKPASPKDSNPSRTTPTPILVAGIAGGKAYLDTHLLDTGLDRRHENTKSGRRALRNWLLKHRVTRAVFEPTGHYQCLAVSGLETVLVNPRQPAGRLRPALADQARPRRCHAPLGRPARHPCGKIACGNHTARAPRRGRSTNYSLLTARHSTPGPPSSATAALFARPCCLTCNTEAQSSAQRRTRL